MKTLIPLTALAALFASSSLFAQTPAFSKPSGYVTEVFKAGQFNLFGLTLQSTPITSGSLSAVTPTTLSDSTKNFSTLLTAGKTYVLEITSANSPAFGAIAEINSWSGSQLTTSPTDLTLVGASNGIDYSIREAATIASVFGANNSAGILAGTLANADILWISNGGGTFDRYYYAVAQGPFVTAGWKLIGGGNTDRANQPIIYTDALILQRKADTDLPLTLTGQVKTTPTIVSISGASFNHIGTIFPVGSTLASTGLAANVVQGTLATADIVWIPSDSTGYNRYYYALAQGPFVTEGWKLIGGGNTDRSADVVKSGIIIQRRGASSNFKITPPPSYSNL